MTARLPLIALLFIALAAQTSEFEGLKKELAAVADKVSRSLTEEGHTKVAIRDFTAPSKLQANFGNALKDELCTQLKEKKIEVDTQAKYEIGGEYNIAPDAANPDKEKAQIGLLIQFEIKEQDSGKSLGKFAHQVFDNNLMTNVGGLNGTSNPHGSVESRNQSIKDKLQKPEFKAGKSEVAVSDYAMEVGVIAGDKFVPRDVSVVDNKFPFVKLAQNEQYGIKLINNADYDVGVLLTVDGLSTFRFSEIRGDKGQQKFTHWIIPARKFTIIKGWHKDFKQVFSFYITDVPNSAAGQLKSTGSIGVISSQWHAVVSGGTHNATDEDKRSANLATGKGPEIDAPSKEVAVKMGASRASITIRYGK